MSIILHTCRFLSGPHPAALQAYEVHPIGGARQVFPRWKSHKYEFLPYLYERLPLSAFSRDFKCLFVGVAARDRTLQLVLREERARRKGRQWEGKRRGKGVAPPTKFGNSRRLWFFHFCSQCCTLVPFFATATHYTGWPKKSKPLSRIIINSFKKIASAAIFLINFEYKMSTRMLLVFIKYSMCDLIRDVIICCVWSCGMGMYMTKSWFKTRKKR